MFTGIVEETGRVERIDVLDDAARLVVHGPLVTVGVEHGASIAVSGVCLTVVEHGDAWFSADVMAETLSRTSLGSLVDGDAVNLERALRADGRFGGHIVQGHVDGVGTISSVTPSDHWSVFRVAMPPELARYVVPKGSIAVDGVSLTVAGVSAPDDREAWFDVSLIPTTLTLTTWGARQVGDQVNLEIDILAKHIERLTAGGMA
jgi:riboflavin synthase